MQKARRHHINAAPTACKHTVSGSISLAYSTYFSPFPHGTSPLSVSQEYLALEDGPPIFSLDFTCPDLLNTANYIFHVRDYHPLRCSFPTTSTIYNLLGFFPFARRYSGNLN